MVVMVTGASGFVGSAVTAELLQREWSVHALLGRRPLTQSTPRLHAIPGGIFDPAALDQALKGCEAAIHLVGIIMERPSHGITFRRMHVEATRCVVDAAVRNGVKRYLHMSALGTRLDAVSEYHKTKFEAEEYVRASGLDWTIFRPSMIHGPHGEFMKMETAWARGTAPPFLFMPYFGAGLFGRGGAGHIQPVFVGDVARAFAEALGNPKTIGEIYPLGGATPLTWPQMHEAVAQAVVGRKRWVQAIPVWKAKLLTRIVPGPLLPFNHDQVVMSQEDGTCDLTKFKGEFGWEPRGFAEALKTYISAP